MECVYKPVLNTHLHYATLSRRGKIIVIARNRVGSRSRGCGWSDETIHAERAVIKKFGDISQLKGCVLEVVRVNKQGQLLNSKPCDDCMKLLNKCINEYGLLKVLYST